jgi:hypothetical protein
LQWRVPFPVVRGRIHHDALHRRRGVVAFLAGSLATVVLRNDNTPAIRIEEDLGGIKSHPVSGIARSFNPVAVDLPRLDTRHEDVPVVVGEVQRGLDANDAGRPGVILPVKEQ